MCRQYIGRDLEWFGHIFFRLWFVFEIPVLSIFLAICVLDLEAAVSGKFASSNFSFSMAFAALWCSNCSFCMVFCSTLEFRSI